MAEETQYNHESRSDAPPSFASAKAEEIVPAADATDRGLFDFVGKKEEENKLDDEFDEKVKIVSEENKEEEIKKKNEGLLDKLHRSNSSNSSSSDDDEEVEGGKKKKGLKEKIKEKIYGQESKKVEDVAAPPPTPATSEYATTLEAECKDQKGLLDKIKEKIPGYHSKSEEEKEKEAAYH